MTRTTLSWTALSAFLLLACSSSTDNSTEHVKPTVTIEQAISQVDPTSSILVDFIATFSEPVTGFTAADVNFAGSTVPGVLTAIVANAGLNDGSEYMITVSGWTGDGTVVVSIPAGGAKDQAGNTNLASTSVDNSVTVVFDDVQPEVTINQAQAQSDPTTSNTVQFTVQFSEPVTGFTASDVSFAGSTVGGSLSTVVTGNGTSFTVGVSGMTTSGTIVASIPADKAADQAGNQNLASTSVDNTVTWQNTAPTVTIDQAVAQADPVHQGPILFTAQFSEAVTGFGAGDISFTGSTAAGTLIATVTGSGPVYTVSVSGMTGSGTVVVSIPAASVLDGAGLGNSASTSVDNTVTFDNVGPGVTINQAAAQADPTSGATIQFTVVFSEPVTGFAAADVSLTGSTVGGTLTVGVTGSGADYTVSVTGMSGAGTVVASVPAGGATDAAGNLNLASTSVDNSVTHQ